MAAFNLTAQLQLQAPNTRGVANQIQRDLSNIKLNIDVGKNAKNLATVQQNLGSVAKEGDRASKSFNLLGRNVAEAARRFSVITVATGSFISLARGIKTSIGSAIEFERELVKISQVTGKTLDQLQSLQGEVTRLSTSLGVANAELLQTSRVLAQAGLSALKTKQALEVLAQTTLAPTFDNIIDTTEGAIAILNQFGRQAAKTGNDIKFLEQSLDAINAVSKNFAVESSDLIATVRRTGGVFQAAGGNLKELIALFTSVRQTTREGAETIATGFRTIFTRLQRKDTIDALNELGISLQDAEGKFVGPLKAIEKLAIGLAGLDPKDVRFNEIVEQLGGFRQIGKVIPLIKQFEVTQRALAVANNSVGSTSKDAQEAQKSLAVQLSKTRESFDALIRKFTASDTFQDSAKFVLKLANTFLKFAESLETVLPLLTTIAAIKLGRSLAPGLLQIFGRGSQRRNAGGKILGFNRGGFVPGQGNGDTVPAMLEPGEFVIRKSSAKEIGASRLQAMNSGGSGVKRAKGGYIPRAQKFAEGGKTGILDTDQIKDKSEANAIRDAIIQGKNIKQLVWGPAGSGKTTLARKIYGENFVKSKQDLEKYNDFIVLSGAQTTKKPTKVRGKGEVPLSQTTVDLVRAAKAITAVIPDQETLTARRDKRVEMADETQAGGDTRSVGQLKASRFAANEEESKKILQLFKSFKKKATDISLIQPTQANPEPEAQKFNAGGNVRDFAKSRQFVEDINTTYRKPLNEEFNPSGSGGRKATRFNTQDEFSFTRQKNKEIDVNEVDQRIGGVRQYKQAVKAKNAQERGFAFERVAESLLGINLEKDASNSRLDATGPGGQRYEIKSLTRDGNVADFSTKGLGEKMVGAAIDPITKTDQRVKDQFTRQRLTASSDGDDINLGRITLIQDVTDSEELARKTKNDGTKRKNAKNAALGGLIQKFALGGIATKNKVGAAILDPDDGIAAESVNVGIKDVSPYITKSTEAQRKGLSKEFSSKKYSIVRQGLNQKTSDGFKDTLLEGAAKGVNDAVSGLGADLGLGSVTPDPSDIGKLKERIRSSGALGGPFENALNILSNKGRFKPAPQNAPFDFPDGLSGAVKDNYDNLPGSYVDAKSSYAAAGTEGIKGKIAQEIAAEYKGSSTYKNLAADTGSGDKAGLQRALRARFPNRSERAGYSLSDFQTATGRKYKASELKELGFTKVGGTKYLNKGGSANGPAPSDTVPAMLTPGEFVFSKKAAESIGYGRLNKMNKKGVEGFAAGGAVGVQKFAAGGGPVESGDFGLTKPKDLALVNAQAKANAAAFKQLTEEINSLNLGADGAKTAVLNFARNFDSAADTALQIQDALGKAGDIENFISPGGADRTGKKQRGVGGESEGRKFLGPGLPQGRSGDEIAEIAREADALAESFQYLGEDTREGQKAVQAYRKALNDGSSRTEALSKGQVAGQAAADVLNKQMKDLNDAYAAGEISQDQLTEATDKLIQEGKAKKLPSGPSGPGGGGGSTESQEEAAARAKEVGDKFNNLSDVLNKFTNAAIGITLVGGTLVESFAGLDEGTKRQTEAALNSAAATIGLFTQVASLGLEIGGQIASSAILKAANRDLAVSAGQASVALKGVGGGGGGGGEGQGKGAAFANVAAVAAIAITGLIAGIKAYNAFLREGLKIQIENANKVADAELEALEGGKPASEEKFVKAREKAAVANLRIAQLNAKEGNQTKGAFVGAAAGAAAAAGGFFAAGIALQGIPVLGTILGAALIAGAGAAYLYAKSQEASAKQQEENLRLTTSIARNSAEVQFRSIKVAKDFQQALKEAGDAGATAAQKVGLLGGFIDNAQAQIAENQQKLEKVREDRAKLRANLVEEGIVSETGETLKSENEIADDASISNRIKQLEELEKQVEAAEKASADLSTNLVSELNNVKIEGKKAVSEAISELTKFGPAALSSVGSLSDLTKRFPELAASFVETRENIEKLVNLSFKSRIKAAEEAGDTDKVAALKTQRDATIEQAQLEQSVSAQELLVAQNKLATTTLLAENAQRQQALTLLKVNKNLSAFNLLLAQSDSLGNIYQQIDDIGNEGSFGAIEFDTTVFDVPFEQLNKKAIERINRLGRGVIGKDAEGFSKSISQTQTVIRDLPSVFADFKRQSENGELINIPDLNTALTEEITKSIPGGLNGLGPDLRAIIKKNVDKAIGSEKIGGGLSLEDQQKLTEELKENVRAQIEVFKRGVEIQNQFLQKQSQINSKIVAAQESTINAFADASKVFERNQDRLAKASENPRSRQERERGRRAAANIALGPDALRAGARAGDVNATLKAFNDLTKKSKDLRDKQRDLIRNGAEFGDNLNDLGIAASKAEAGSNEAAKGAARARAELERLADQSAKAADIEKDLSELRGRRAEAEGLQESVAFGTDDQRQEIFKGFALLNRALAQGSIAGATGDQRQLISQALDSVGSQLINFEGQQVTGKELKQILAARETGRLGLGGLNQFIDGLRKAENPLLGELKELGKQELTASLALAGIEAAELTELKGIRKDLRNVFGEDLAAAQAGAQGEIGAGEQQQQEVIKRNNEVIDGLRENLGKLTPVLSSLKKQLEVSGQAVTSAVKVIQDLDNNKSDSPQAVTKSRGGSVYMNRGGVVPGSASTPKGMEEVFKPKGTDTVPAMLQQGEFVIKKSSVDKIGKDTLQQMNNGGTVYAANGFNAGLSFGSGKKSKFDLSGVREAEEALKRAKGGAVYLFGGGSGTTAVISKQREREKLKEIAKREGISVEEAARRRGEQINQRRLKAVQASSSTAPNFVEQAYLDVLLGGSIRDQREEGGLLAQSAVESTFSDFNPEIIARNKGTVAGSARTPEEKGVYFQEPKNEEEFKERERKLNETIAEEEEQARQREARAKDIAYRELVRQGKAEEAATQYPNIDAKYKAQERRQDQSLSESTYNQLVRERQRRAASRQADAQERLDRIDQQSNKFDYRGELRTGYDIKTGEFSEPAPGTQELVGLSSESYKSQIQRLKDEITETGSDAARAELEQLQNEKIQLEKRARGDFLEVDTSDLDKEFKNPETGEFYTAKERREIQARKDAEAQEAYNKRTKEAQKRADEADARFEAGQKERKRQPDGTYQGGATVVDLADSRARDREKDAEIERLNSEFQLGPTFGETEEEKQARTFARIRELQNETITMPDGSTRKLTNSEISDQIAQEATQATYSDRQLATMGRSSGFFGSDAATDAIMQNGLDVKFDDEGILVAGDAPNKPVTRKSPEPTFSSDPKLRAKAKKKYDEQQAKRSDIYKDRETGAIFENEEAAVAAGIQSAIRRDEVRRLTVDPNTGESQKSQEEKSKYKQQYYKDNNIASDAIAPIEKEAAEKYAEREYQTRLREDASKRREDRKDFVYARKAGYSGNIEDWRNTRDVGNLADKYIPPEKRKEAEEKKPNKADAAPAGAAPAATGDGSEVAKVKQRQAEEDARSKKIVEDIGPPDESLKGVFPDDGLRDSLKANIEADKQAELDAAKAKDQAAASGQLQTNEKSEINRFSQAKYNRLLRTNGPAVANRYARANGKTSDNARNKNQAGKKAPQGQEAILKLLFNLLKGAGIKNPADFLKQAQGFNNGGGTQDTIPAMLTPGEFVVNPKSAQKIGMKNLKEMNENGVMPQKFAKGGVVGGMKTSYLSDGGNGSGGMGPLEINTGPLTEVFDKFSAAFGSRLDNILGQFDFIAGAVDNLATAINNGMKISHSFSGDMTMTFNLGEEQVSNIVSAVGNAMTPKIEEIIKKEVDQKFNKNSFKAGG